MRDFTMIFGAYSQFEETLISALIERQAVRVRVRSYLPLTP